MGINFYIGKYCTECAQYSRILHIGKKSCGRRFTLAVSEEYPDEMSWIKKLTSLKSDEIILDENKNKYTSREFLVDLVHTMLNAHKYELPNGFKQGLLCDCLLGKFS